MAKSKEQRLIELAEHTKAKNFILEFQKEHGYLPAIALVKGAQSLTEEEMAKIQLNIQADNLIEMADDYENGVIVIPDGTISELDVPVDTTIKTIKANFEEETTINFSTVKSVSIQNLDENVVIESLTINAPASSANTTITVSANCGTITAVNANVTVPAPYTVENIVLITSGNEETSKITVNANFAENASIQTDSSNEISINNKNGEEEVPSLNLDAQNATVTLNGKWDEVEAAVSENTLVINGSAHINNLVVSKGNVLVNVPRMSDIANVIGEYELAQGCSIDYLKYAITNENSSKLGGVGEMTLMENITRSSSLVSPLSPAWNAVWMLNGHSLIVTGTPSSGVYLNKYMSNLEVNGEGTIRCENSYGLWNSSSNGGKIVINGGNIEANTHAAYAQNGVIEINGGTFKLTNAATADRDENGNLRYLLNCYDSSYQSGKANIIVKGGVFYEFDPADNASEGPHTNYVAEGYKSVESMEEGLKVYTVVKDE